ncbi:MAG: (2Fe-2S)-binding protein [Desulfobacterota bacterium]|nr:(2Fe-2S)-binding protein [Thermodesulfobacteriota bacterium]
MAETIDFFLNGELVSVQCPENETLLYLLRERVGLRSVKEGCGVGECGACTVLLEGRAVNACLLAAGKVRGRRVTTIEGLSPKGRLHPLQEGFLLMGAVQCGFCTPGLILAAHSLLEENPHPSREAIVQGLAGNLCRCTGYHDIIRAVKWAAKRMPERE